MLYVEQEVSNSICKRFISAGVYSYCSGMLYVWFHHEKRLRISVRRRAPSLLCCTSKYQVDDLLQNCTKYTNFVGDTIQQQS